MVGSLTLGKKKYAAVQDDIKALKAKASALQAELIRLVALDGEVFEPLAAAYGLPKETAEEQAHKAEVMEKCLRQCVAVPLEIMERLAEAIDLHKQFAAKGTAIAISDVGCGVICCKAALQAASLNVFINTKSMADSSYAATVNQQANDLLDKYKPKADAIFADVAARLVS
jgi:formiminotetrahydrofolate cyclodeaminase